MGLVSGTAKKRSSHSISAMVRSASISSQYPTEAWQRSNAMSEIECCNKSPIATGCHKASSGATALIRITRNAACTVTVTGFAKNLRKRLKGFGVPLSAQV